MTSARVFPSPDTRIFFLSAFGSVLLHGIIITLLTFLPSGSVEEEPIPTVQVKLVSAPNKTQPSDLPVPQALSPSRPLSPPPLPISPKTQDLITSLPLSLMQPSHNSTRPSAKKTLPPPQPLKRILKDNYANNAIKARDMMHMIMPRQQQIGSSSPPNTRPTPDFSPAIHPEYSNSTRRKPKPTLAPPKPYSSAEKLSAQSLESSRASMTKPTLLTSSRPLYPRIARESGWEGTVMVRMLITTDGTASQIAIRKSSGHPLLDKAAQEAVKRWTFRPGKDGNIPIPKWVDIPIKFDLDR